MIYIYDFVMNDYSLLAQDITHPYPDTHPK